MESSEVSFQFAGRIGWIRLNRPRVINAITAEMAEKIALQLERWKTEPDLRLVVISGEGERGFCAGGDMARLYEARNSGITELAARLFGWGYRLDYIVYRYPVPVLVWMDGVVMGGGAGIGSAASHRIVTERTKWAMPELNIGFFPDVGSSYFLNRMPGRIGLYLALTSSVITGEDLLYLGAAEVYTSSGRWDEAKANLQSLGEGGFASRQLSELLAQMQDKPTRPSRLAALRERIDDHFARATIEDILASLERAAGEGDEWAWETLTALRRKPPTSLKVTLRQFQSGRGKSLADCLRMEMDMSMNFVAHDDLYEGIRAVLIDKDRNPRWQPAELGDVDERRVRSFFRYDWPGGRHPLAELASETVSSRK